MASAQLAGVPMFADGTGSVLLADLSGDGLTDLAPDPQRRHLLLAQSGPGRVRRAKLLVQLTRHLVETGLAASGNIVDKARSVYRWDSEIREADEAIASLRTQARHVDAIVAATKESHPYEFPHVVAMSIVRANPDYERWVIESTGGVGT